MDDRHLIRSEAGAILNTDNAALQAYKRKKEAIWNADHRLNMLEEKINKIFDMLEALK